MRTEMMRDASYLLPDPGGEVVRTLLDEIDRLKGVERMLVELQEAVREYAELIDKFDTEYFGATDVTPGLKSRVIAARAAVDALVGE